MTGQVRYNTLENKSFRFLNVRRYGDLKGTVNVRTVQAHGTEADLYTFPESSANVEIQVVPSAPVESLGLKFTVISPENTAAASRWLPLFASLERAALDATTLEDCGA